MLSSCRNLFRSGRQLLPMSHNVNRQFTSFHTNRTAIVSPLLSTRSSIPQRNSNSIQLRHISGADTLAIKTLESAHPERCLEYIFKVAQAGPLTPEVIQIMKNVAHHPSVIERVNWAEVARLSGEMSASSAALGTPGNPVYVQGLHAATSNKGSFNILQFGLFCLGAYFIYNMMGNGEGPSKFSFTAFFSAFFPSCFPAFFPVVHNLPFLAHSLFFIQYLPHSNTHINTCRCAIFILITFFLCK